MRIGFDFDNTLVCYDHCFSQAAAARGWLPESPGSEVLTKRTVSQKLRTLEEGEQKWQELQAYCYGPGMTAATLMAGADRFIRTARQRGARCVIVSHKTRFSPLDREQRYDLRQAAVRWMQANRFFHADGLGFVAEDVSFTSTRLAKVQQIVRLRLDVFIDDLAEVFLEPEFPRVPTQSLLLDRDGLVADHPAYRRFSHWDGLHDALF
ncbi:MAG: hypothetical protein HQL73_06760 [Magnetococcales bacterium]|nr:hypothetical protein [Magnetococcales bacterium]